MFNSRNPAFREPVGAVPAGTAVHFKITMPRDMHCSAAHLLVTDDASGQQQTLGMFWCGMNGEQHEWWECHFVPPEAGLYFYRFCVDAWDGPHVLSCTMRGEAVFSENGFPWQLTVFRPGFSTPDWLRGGIIYQIFPDRFFRSSQEKKDIPSDRKIHAVWGEQPDWKPDETGKITNSDYFGGDLRGIEEKLDYLESLGVTCLYLNPIFEAHSNHRYNTADYRKIDPLLGTEEDFRSLCAAAGQRGIRVLLDGVFNHTGSDSVYFNREGRYPESLGAYQSEHSPYYPWYRFRSWPDNYECWWNFQTLPRVNCDNPDFRQFICGSEGAARKWLRAGASGWRLDVADELSDSFLENLRCAVKAEKSDAVLFGEVWEDASNKTAYGRRRRYLLGDQLDSVMNYPFRNAILSYLNGGKIADAMEQIRTVLENYPPQSVSLLMNNIGTHDTERALTVLAGEPAHGREWQSHSRLTAEQRVLGLRKMRLASLMQYTLPGVPCLYYGDEAGMEGYRDPFNRSCFPWGKQDAGLTTWYQKLGQLRKLCPCLKDGEFSPLRAAEDIMAYVRRSGNDTLLCAFNRGGAAQSFPLTAEWQGARALLGPPPDNRNVLTLPPMSCCALRPAEDS